LVSHTKGRTYIEGVKELGAEENSLTKGGKWWEVGEDCIMRSL